MRISAPSSELCRTRVDYFIARNRLGMYCSSMILCIVGCGFLCYLMEFRAVGQELGNTEFRAVRQELGNCEFRAVLKASVW